VPSPPVPSVEAAGDMTFELADPGQLTLLEAALPIREINRVVAADRRGRDHAYAAHRWWARRPPAAVRALLLAIASPATTEFSDYWAAFGDDAGPLAGLSVHDAFVGGGSTVIEAARLGATVSGGDIDPLAVEIVNHQLDPPSVKEFTAAASELLRTITSRASKFYPPGDTATSPLHYFYLRSVTCPTCGFAEPLHRTRLIARDIGKVGSVVRNAPLTVFCPACLDVHHLSSASRKTFRCCGTRWHINQGTYTGARHQCTKCGMRSSHEELQTGAAPSLLLAVEETSDTRRHIRAATDSDRAALESAARSLAQLRAALPLPRGELRPDRKDARPRSFGVTRHVDLFTDRQLLVFGEALRWLDATQLDERVARGLRLAISNALSTNNRLCGYASDYGRLSSLFSVRGYAIPALAVELNPLHPTAGRGTLPRTIERVRRSLEVTVNRSTWDPRDQKVVRVPMTRSPAGHGSVTCQSAATVITGFADLAVFDPPYFDYIAYDELSEFHRAWLGSDDLGGEPLHAGGPDKTNQFGLDFGAALRAIRGRLAPGRPMAFTYHSSDPEGWNAVGIAVDEAKLCVTGIWPLRNDAHMGPHIAGDNCEWDVVVVCRRLTECSQLQLPATFNGWRKAAGTEARIGPADRGNLEAAILMASARFGQPNQLNGRSQSLAGEDGQSILEAAPRCPEVEDHHGRR
jgi:putative DNA methylase